MRPAMSMFKPAAEFRSQAPADRPIRPVKLGPRDVDIERRAGGVIMLKSPHPLEDYPDKITERLEYWAARAPDRILFAQRDKAGGWRRLTYGAAVEQARRLAEALLRRNLSAERPIVILSGNDIEHATIALAALYIGVPHAPISPAYSLVSSDFGKLKHIMKLLTPGLVFAADGHAFTRAITAAVPPDVELVVTANPPGDRAATLISDLLAVAPSPAVDAAHRKVGPDTIAKFLFTSGSTGMPKAVINTQRMWCSNQEMIRTSLAFFQDEPPVIVDWAPWHHTAGGNHDVGLVIFNGGTFYIDEGKPLPGAIEATVRNLREIAPTWYFNVPKGYETLLPYLRDDRTLRETFFSRLKVLWFAGAALSQHVFDEMKELAFATCGEQILFLTGLGATETAPFAMARTWEAENAFNMGLPPPGVAIKLVPIEDRYEGRLRGPNITPGYWRDPDLTRKAFDEEGFYRLGDAFRLADPDDPAQGLLFAGRIAEDFKLATGTWVSVAALRTLCLSHFAPYIRDVVIAGADQNHVSVLIFPDLAACRSLCPELPADAAAETVVAHPKLRAHMRAVLERIAGVSTGASTRIRRAILLTEPPSLDVGEVTDKGSINQRAVLTHRAQLVNDLYAVPAPAHVLSIEVKP